MKLLLSAFLIISCFSASQPTFAETPAGGDIDTDIKKLKSQVIELNRDLLALEKDLLFSANTGINVFLSMNDGKLFQLDSVQLKIDDVVVSNYLYTSRGNKALSRGGVQKLYTGNLKPGEHEITAIFTGQGPDKKTVKQEARKTIKKSDKAQFLELKVIDISRKKHAEFLIKTWEL